MPNAGWIAPAELVKALFNAADKTNRLTIETNTHITEIKQIASDADSQLKKQPPSTLQWLLLSAKDEFKASVLIICAGADSIKINVIDQLPLTSVRGQVSSMKTNNKINKLSTVVCHKGYLTPANKQHQHCIGATFDKNSFNIKSVDKDDDYNINMLNNCLPGLTDWQRKDIAKSKARLRCMTPDHLPMVGAMPDIEKHITLYAHLRKDKNWRFDQAAPVIDNLYVLTGLGARGLCSAPLVADILTADLCGTPYPVDSKMLFNLAPNRFIIRDLIKRKV
jgi:tRNA 5-methylaminomethyl-2-thiouridine biosynthesis bifunctional protein